MSKPTQQAGDRLKVLFAIADMGGGGAERVVSNYLRHLDRTRFEPALCLWREVYKYEVPKDVPVFTVHKRSPMQFFGAVPRTARVIKEWKPDVVFSHLCYVNVCVGMALSAFGLEPLWMPCVHNNPENRRAYLYNLILGQLGERAVRFSTVSGGVSKRFCEKFGVSADKMVTLYNPIDFADIDASVGSPTMCVDESTTTIGTMGRLVDQKDHVTLLNALRQLHEEHKVRLLIMGEGPRRSELEKVVQTLGMEEQVDFLGFVSNPYSVLAECDIFVLSSLWEGLPTALIEAMAVGVPSVSTDCPCGPSEIIEDGKTGLLVPVGEANGLARAINRLIEDRELRRKLGDAGKDSVREKFSAERRTRVLEQTLTQIWSESGCEVQ